MSDATGRGEAVAAPSTQKDESVSDHFISIREDHGAFESFERFVDKMCDMAFLFNLILFILIQDSAPRHVIKDTFCSS